MLLLLLVPVMMMLEACGGSDGSSGSDPDSAVGGVPSTDAPGTTGQGDRTDVVFDVRPPIDAADVAEPPTIRIATAEEVLLDLRPWTTCWTNYCADGAPPQTLEIVEGEPELFVEFPVEGWTFSATAKVDELCGRRQSTTLESVSPTVFRLPAPGEVGDHAVDVFGTGAGGDVIVTFGWITDVAGEFGEPSATLSLLADHDGVVDSYGVEFSLSNLVTDPDKVSAEVLVTAENGKSHRIEFEVDEQIACDLGVGNLFLRAPDTEGRIAAALGQGPFVYEVVLVLDDVEHRATANWPGDVEEECAPCVPLNFEPSLAVTGGDT